MMFRHLRENNMGYFEHFVFAASHGVSAIVVGVGLLIHAVFPPLFPRAGRVLLARLKPDFDSDPRDFAAYLDSLVETR